MSNQHTMFQNDLLPVLEVFVVDYEPTTGAETAKDLSDEDLELKLYMKLKEDAPGYAIDGAALTAVDAEEGQFKYVWQDGDTATAGTYLCDIRLFNTDTEQQQTIDRFELIILEAV